MPDTPPIVLVVVDENSRLSILRHEGVMVAFLDRRVDPAVVLLPPAHQALEMHAAIRDFPIISIGADDAAKSASAVNSMLDRGRIVVASGPERT